MRFEANNVGRCGVHPPQTIFILNGSSGIGCITCFLFFLFFLGIGIFFDAQQFLDQKNGQLLHVGPSKGVGKGASSQGVAIVNLIISLLFF